MKVLQFSGGRDSLACLYLLEPLWNELTVVWVNAGAAFPEVLELMDRVRKLVPNFREIRSRLTIEQRGYPVDVLPVSATPVGTMLEEREGSVFQSRYDCCRASLFEPMLRAMKAWGVTTIIRGQKRSDRRRSPIRDGQVVDGIRYEFPLEAWTDEDVCAYLEERGVPLPRNYTEGMTTGLDCWCCTAFLDEQGGRFDYMRAHHPEKLEHVRRVLIDYRAALNRDLDPTLRMTQWA